MSNFDSIELQISLNKDFGHHFLRLSVPKIQIFKRATL